MVADLSGTRTYEFLEILRADCSNKGIQILAIKRTLLLAGSI